ncbi:unnamed protein product [Adineta steineri]|uniref:G-protein coupled receptors family 1 profile domain-containing protein n=1 Tax=Adineta steineri TaxID=433720 RepID=A0A813P733_9BILA|nr:unnamed protein product [Adineta steineri]CAF0750857.1 unnamed protein product [Adineta steineri]CAF3792001.1 unnamed protein product [Adineta steineri]CAF4059314.1 unnamed protein product [Adineta steineri]
MLIWMAAFMFACPYIVTNTIEYSVDGQLCQMPLHLSFLFLAVYNVFCTYIIPMNGIKFIYLKLIRYVREMNKRATLVNILLRAKKQLKMVFRIVILISIFLIFVFMRSFTSPPKYHFRIALTFIAISTVFVMITLFKFTDPVQTSIMKRINRRSNIVVAIMK